MLNEKKDLIKRLAEDLFLKHQTYEMLGMINSYGKSYEERKEQHTSYRLAEAEWLEARTKLREAQNK